MKNLFKNLLLLVFIFVLVFSLGACKKVDVDNSSTHVSSEDGYIYPQEDVEIDMSEDGDNSTPSTTTSNNTTTGSSNVNSTSGTSSTTTPTVSVNNSGSSSQTGNSSKAPTSSVWDGYTGDYNIKPSL